MGRHAQHMQVTVADLDHEQDVAPGHTHNPTVGEVAAALRAHYRDGRRQGEGAVALDEAAELHAQGGFVWLGLFGAGVIEDRSSRRRRTANMAHVQDEVTDDGLLDIQEV